MIGEKMRRYGFWGLDRMRGGPIGGHYREIKRLMEESASEEAHGQRMLEALLRHAVQETDYYAGMPVNATLSDFPVINKNVIKSSDQLLVAKPFLGKKLHTMSTSGSTGMPFSVVQDVNKRHRVMAEIIYFGEQCGYFLGDRYVYIRAWSVRNRKHRMNEFKHNLVAIDATRLDEAFLEEVRNRLRKDSRIKCILTYGSFLDRLSGYLWERGDGPDDYHVKIVISTGDHLSDRTRQITEAVFGCACISRYANMENGILAQELSGREHYVVNRASYHVEFLEPDSDKEAQPGKPARVVLTDLFNYAMPLIRYDTGDVAIYQIDGNGRKIISRIEGRRLDLIEDTGSRLISSIVVGAKLRESWEEFTRIRQYQLIQEDRIWYRILLNGASQESDEPVRKALQQLLGEDAVITVQHVSGIPVTSSGKFSYVKNEYASARYLREQGNEEFDDV